MTAIIAGMRVVGWAGEVVQMEGRARVRGAAPAGGHETNLKCFMNKFRHEMRLDL